MSIFLHLLYIYWPFPQFLCTDLQGKILKPGVLHTLSQTDSVSATFLVRLTSTKTSLQKKVNSEKNFSLNKEKNLTDLFVNKFFFSILTSWNLSLFCKQLQNEHSIVSGKAFSLKPTICNTFHQWIFSKWMKRRNIFFQSLKKKSYMKKNFQNCELFKDLEDDLHKAQITIWD